MTELLCSVAFPRKGFSRPKLNLACVRKAVVVGPGSALEVDASVFSQYLGTGQGFDTLYELGGKIGSGTSSVVRSAFSIPQSETGESRRVAVKCISSDDEEIRAFGLGEYRLLQSLDHPCIIKAHGLYVNSRHSLMVMELCGDSLFSHVERVGPLTQPDATPLFHQILKAIGHLHSKRIVHRDVKPDNLLLCDHAKTIKLVDFNSATRIGVSEGSIAMLSERGTHLFSSPEILLGRTWNERTDIWACGFSFFFMLHGVLPFDCMKQEVKKRLADGKLPEVAWSDVPHVVCHLIEQCLAVDMRDRPPALELLQHQLFAPSHPQRRHSLASRRNLPELRHGAAGIQRSRSTPELRWNTPIQRSSSTPELRWTTGLGTCGTHTGMITDTAEDVSSIASEVLRSLQLCKLARTETKRNSYGSSSTVGAVAGTKRNSRGDPCDTSTTCSPSSSRH